MKSFTKTIALMLIMAGALTARAQERLYAVVEYMQIPEGRSQEDYIGLEKLWQRLHQKAVDTGICRGWYLDRVQNNARNQYVTIRIYDSLDKMANPWPDSLSAGLYNSEESAKMRRTGEFRNLTQSELWEVEASAMKADDKSPAPMHVHFMKPHPGKADEYYQMERNQYQKIHQARIDAGQLRSWFFVSRLFPGGTDRDYSFVTLNSYVEKAPAWDNKIVQATLGKEEWEKMPDPDTIRTIVRQEIWHPVLRTNPAKKQ